MRINTKREIYSAIALSLILSSTIWSSKGYTKSCNCCQQIEAMSECTYTWQEENKEKTNSNPKDKSDSVEVIYFHTKQRSNRCHTFERLTIETIRENFAAELNQGRLKLASIDISTLEGRQIANSYNIEESALFISKSMGSSEGRDNMTSKWAHLAENQPQKYKSELKFLLTTLLRG